MLLKFILYYLTLILCSFNVHGFLDPLSVGLTAGAVYAIHRYFYSDQTTVQNIIQFGERCTSSYINLDLNGFENDLESNLFGQHIVKQLVIPSLKSHFDFNGQRSNKPLVLSFHGTPGTGKNYVSDFIVKNIYKYGVNSKYVHKFLGRSDFPLESEILKYRAEVNARIRKAMLECSKSVFIFDEVDKMPQGVFDSITSLLDHHYLLDGVNYGDAIFILLSNTAGIEISNKLGQLTEHGILRENTKLHDFERTLEVAAYNLDGGLRRAAIIESHLIDHFIPFLPLEKKHIEQCLRREFRIRFKQPNDQTIKYIIDNYVTFKGLFATAGCKRLNKKVEVIIHGKDP